MKVRIKISDICIYIYIYTSKKRYEDKHVDLFLVREKYKKYYILLKEFNTFMCEHTLHFGLIHFLPLLFTTFQYRRNIKMSYLILL